MCELSPRREPCPVTVTLVLLFKRSARFETIAATLSTVVVVVEDVVLGAALAPPPAPDPDVAIPVHPVTFPHKPANSLVVVSRTSPLAVEPAPVCPKTT